jgi:hypothetical protein
MNIILKVSNQDGIITISRDIRVKGGEEFHLSHMLHWFEHARIYINDMEGRPPVPIFPDFDYWEFEVEDYKIKSLVLCASRERSVEEVFNAALECFSELYFDEYDGSRKTECVLTRQITCACSRVLTNLTQNSIALSVHKRHDKHDIVIYSIRKIQSYIDTRDERAMPFLSRMADKLSEPNLITLIKQIKIRKNGQD